MNMARAGPEQARSRSASGRDAIRRHHGLGQRERSPARARPELPHALQNKRKSVTYSTSPQDSVRAGGSGRRQLPLMRPWPAPTRPPAPAASAGDRPLSPERSQPSARRRGWERNVDSISQLTAKCPAAMSDTKPSHALGEKTRTSLARSLLSLTPTRPPGKLIATSTHAPFPAHRELLVQFGPL
jgi:hypothetical protein